jgi:hypothetical protein
MSAPGEWIEWKGGECPVSPDTRVHVRMRHLLYPQDGRGVEMTMTFRAGDIEGWQHEGNAGDIIAYRVVNP